MKNLKFLVTFILFVNFFSLQQISAQNDIKKLKTEIKNKENQISANEEILVSGVKALKRVKANLEDFKKSKRATKRDVNRKRKNCCKHANEVK